MAGRKGKNAGATPIRVTVPVSVACDLDKFQRALANVAAMLGDVRRSSGIGVTLSRTREFVIDPASLQVQEAAAE
ncbi:MAG TPA: hypothetical protein VLL05_00370 [Terriglobales bacterium]|nr:hypothetical protein [Terriglobales bacterium]